MTSLVVGVVLGTAAELHVEGDFRAHDLPGIAEAEPFVGQLDLPAVTNRLIENAELVADAIPDRRDVERGERVHVTRRQPAEAAIAEAGLFLLLEHVRQVLANSSERLFRCLPNPEAYQAVAEMRAGQEFG